MTGEAHGPCGDCGHDRRSHDGDRYCWATTAGARGAETCTCARYAPTPGSES